MQEDLNARIMNMTDEEREAALAEFNDESETPETEEAVAEDGTAE